MPVAVIATMTVHSEKTADFERFFKDLAQEVRNLEPGNLVYQFGRSRTDPSCYRIIEVYQNDEAVDLHGKSAHLFAARSMFAVFLDGRPEVEFLDIID